MCVCPVVQSPRGKLCVIGVWGERGGRIGKDIHEDSCFHFEKFKGWMREINPTPKPVKTSKQSFRVVVFFATAPPAVWLQSTRECRRVRRAKSCCTRPAGPGPPRGKILPSFPPRPAGEKKKKRQTKKLKTLDPNAFCVPNSRYPGPSWFAEGSRGRKRTREKSKLWGALEEVSGEISRWKPQPGR